MQQLWQSKIYNYGFLMTSIDNSDFVCQRFDFSKWKKVNVSGYLFLVHSAQSISVYQNENDYYVLIGHAYNPFSNEIDEKVILNKLSSINNENDYRNYFDQLTGIFAYFVIKEGKIISTSDCSGIYPVYYCKDNNEIYYSSYSQLIADILSFKESDYVKSMKRSKLFHFYGWFLPGDLSPYNEVKRIIPNTEIVYNGDFSCVRFYPRKEYKPILDSEYNSAIEYISELLQNNLKLISEKWNNPAISLTGGVDSQTTLASAKKVQNKFSYYSYISLPREKTDALAAEKICNDKNLNHRIFEIECDKSKLSDFDDVDSIVERHYSYLGHGNENDICKRICLSEDFNYDIEVKSWVSEVYRASRYKMYGKTSFPKEVTPRMLTTMYKVFLFDRKSAKSTDDYFDDYLINTSLKNCLKRFNYPWTEFFVWEIVFGGWGSLSLVGEHFLSNNITIPYNNRAILDFLMRMPLSKRISDELNFDLIKYMDRDLYDLHIHIINGNETKVREFAEKSYYRVHSLLPF